MFTLERFNDAGARLEPSVQVLSFNAARYAAALTAQQQDCKVSIYDEDGDPRGCTYPSVTAAQVAAIAHQDMIDRLAAARDHLTHVIDKTRFMLTLADDFTALGGDPEQAAAMVVAAHALAKRAQSMTIFGTPCQVVAAESNAADWYEDAFTLAYAKHLDIAEAEGPEPDDSWNALYEMRELNETR